MRREEAIEWLGRIKDRYIHGGDEGFDNARRKAIDMAIEALQATEHDGCEGCKYAHKDQYEMPCLMCKQSKLDLWEEEQKK